MRFSGAAGFAALLAVIAATAALFYPHQGNTPSVSAPRPVSQRPPLMLLTTLPIIFPEGFILKAPPSPALKALQSCYRVLPISVADAGELDRQRLLLMAQPRAQPAEALVDLDNWVRGGGRVLLLADPALEWPSDRPLGSPLRPPFAFADTGLLSHWGLRLHAPDRLGPAAIRVDGLQLSTQSPGILTGTDHQCSVDASGFIARCRIGSGKATVIADADFANTNSVGGDASNLDVLLIELERLEH